MTSQVFLRKADVANPLSTVRELLNECRFRELIAGGARVVIKPNLCTERLEQLHTANTSIGVLRAVCEVVREQTARITIVESDGAPLPGRGSLRKQWGLCFGRGVGPEGREPLQG